MNYKKILCIILSIPSYNAWAMHSKKTGGGVTALHYACTQGDIAKVRYLISCNVYPAPLTTKKNDNPHQTPLRQCLTANNIPLSSKIIITRDLLAYAYNQGLNLVDIDDDQQNNLLQTSIFAISKESHQKDEDKNKILLFDIVQKYSTFQTYVWQNQHERTVFNALDYRYKVEKISGYLYTILKGKMEQAYKCKKTERNNQPFMNQSQLYYTNNSGFNTQPIQWMPYSAFQPQITHSYSHSFNTMNNSQQSYGQTSYNQHPVTK